jgi:hypothetical protein
MNQKTTTKKVAKAKKPTREERLIMLQTIDTIRQVLESEETIEGDFIDELIPITRPIFNEQAHRVYFKAKIINLIRKL